MRNLTVMFATAVCFLFLLKLKWPKNKNLYGVTGLVLRPEIFRLGQSFSSHVVRSEK